MSRQPYRSEMGIIGDILDVVAKRGQNGALISAISRQANLSHYAVVDKCKRLVQAGLIDAKKDEKNRIFTLTEKGSQFYRVQKVSKHDGNCESKILE